MAATSKLMQKAAAVLDLPMGDNAVDARTVREYLIALLSEVWSQGEGFSGKRPFGDSGWEHELYFPLVKAGMIRGKIVDGFADDADHAAGDKLISRAIKALAVKP